jgi:ribose transport system permease protein
MSTTTTPTGTVGTTTPATSTLRKLFARQEVTLLLVVLLIVAVTALRSPTFFSVINLTQVLEGAVIYFIVACGSALLVIGGGLDFSVGAAFTFGGLSTALLLHSGVPVVIAILLGLIGCVVIGAVNHLIITYWHVPPIIATLGTFYALLGITTQISAGQDVLPLPDAFEYIAQSKLAGIPMTIVIAVLVGFVTWFLLEYTTFGTNVRALGGNRVAALGNGLSVKRLDLLIYVAAASTAGLAGILYASRVGSGQVAAGGATLTLTVITAVLIGGVSLQGGLGSIQGVAVGAVLLSLIDNALIHNRIPPTNNSLIVGGILVVAVAFDHLRRQRLYRVRR